MGIPGAFDHPDYVAAVARIVTACERAGKVAAFLATDERSARDAVARGFRMFAYGIDQLMLQDALRTGLTMLRDARR
jgi:2-dehydro-3-deoxyglucarate aldolase/4-hydroxy-2-oxoheptanedioate aldolase